MEGIRVLKKTIWILLASGFIGTAAFAEDGASTKNAPKPFDYRDGQAVFVDFKTATYKIEYSATSGVATVDSEIEFESGAEGYPVFDLIPEPTEVFLDGERIAADEVRSPDSRTKFRILGAKATAGTHTLKVKNLFTKDIVRASEKIASGIWTTDLEDRGYLEKYVPSNLEFDQFPSRYEISVVGGAAVDYRVFTNGKLEVKGKRSFAIENPAFFNTTSFFLHLVPADAVDVVEADYTSVDGRSIPITVYGKKGSSSLNTYRDETLKLLKELETDYGPWPHPALLVYGAGSGGMEYSGATITSLDALGHEMFHSYHARGLMPGNGNSGWMDEAIASWRDIGYQLRSSPGYLQSNMGNQTPYNRQTSFEPYSRGRDFLASVAQKLSDKGLSFKTFLREYFEAYKYQTVDSQDFVKELNEFSGIDFDSSFDRYIFGRSQTGGLFSVEVDEEKLEDGPLHPFHRPLSEEERDALLFP
jgi:hypothetical protein